MFRTLVLFFFKLVIVELARRIVFALDINKFPFALVLQRQPAHAPIDQKFPHARVVATREFEHKRNLTRASLLIPVRIRSCCHPKYRVLKRLCRCCSALIPHNGITHRRCDLAPRTPVSNRNVCEGKCAFPCWHLIIRRAATHSASRFSAWSLFDFGLLHVTRAAAAILLMLRRSVLTRASRAVFLHRHIK